MRKNIVQHKASGALESVCVFICPCSSVRDNKRKKKKNLEIKRIRFTRTYRIMVIIITIILYIYIIQSRPDRRKHADLLIPRSKASRGRKYIIYTFTFLYSF